MECNVGGGRSEHEVITTSKELADLLVRQHFDVIHVAAFVCPPRLPMTITASDGLQVDDAHQRLEPAVQLSMAN